MFAEGKYGFLYVDANSGQSSGGHSALVLDDKVYHLQYSFEDRIFHIVREPWSEFRFQYGILQNRNIELYTPILSSIAKREWKTRWNELYQIQKLWLGQIQNIGLEREALSTISGLGYYSEIDADTSEVFFPLSFDEKKKVQSQIVLGEKELESIEPEFPKLSQDSFSEFRKPKEWKGFHAHSQRIIQSLFVRKFILSPKVPILSEFINTREMGVEPFTKQELSSLIRYRQNIVTALSQCLFVYSCESWEELTLLHRLVYLEISIQEKYFILPKKQNEHLNYFVLPHIPEPIRDEKEKEYRLLYQITKENFFAKEDPFSYVDLEDKINRWHSFRNGKFDVGNWEFALPGPYLFFWPTRSSWIEKEAKYLLLVSEEKRTFDTYISNIQNLYSYHLIFKNCTNDLFRYETVLFPDGKFSDDTKRFNLNSNWISGNFIPSLVAYRLSSAPNLLDRRVYPSYRNLWWLEKTAEKEQTLLEFWREQTTISSSIYKPNSLDDPFLFFTDQVFWTRPLLGIANSVYGLGHMTAGVFTAPIDRGERLWNGSASVFYSLPELAFFSIRKGYFPYLSWKDLPKEVLKEKHP